MTVSASSLASGNVSEGFGTSQAFTISSVTAPANSLLALWLADSENLEPGVSGLSLTWTETAEQSCSSSGHLVLMTATVGSSGASGTISVSYSGGQPAVAWDLDSVSGNAGEVPKFGISASGAVTAYGYGPPDGSGDISVTLAKGPVFYLFGSAASNGSSLSASVGESPAWTELAQQRALSTASTDAIALETQVSPDASHSTAIADWSGWGILTGGTAGIGIPISV